MTDAEKREKVIRELERFINNYKRYITDWEPVTNALACLKEQDEEIKCLRARVRLNAEFGLQEPSEGDGNE